MADDPDFWITSVYQNNDLSHFEIYTDDPEVQPWNKKYPGLLVKVYRIGGEQLNDMQLRAHKLMKDFKNGITRYKELPF